jgi:hypothetical protein
MNGALNHMCKYLCLQMLKRDGQDCVPDIAHNVIPVPIQGYGQAYLLHAIHSGDDQVYGGDQEGDRFP